MTKRERDAKPRALTAHGGLDCDAKLFWMEERNRASGFECLRVYYVGRIRLHGVRVGVRHVDDSSPEGRFVVFIDERGNGGRTFRDEKRMHEYIADELTESP